MFKPQRTSTARRVSLNSTFSVLYPEEKMSGCESSCSLLPYRSDADRVRGEGWVAARSSVLEVACMGGADGVDAAGVLLL